MLVEKLEGLVDVMSRLVAFQLDVGDGLGRVRLGLRNVSRGVRAALPIQRLGGVTRAALELVLREVRGDGIEPGREFGGAIVVIDLLEDPEEGLLRQILRSPE